MYTSDFMEQQSYAFEDDAFILDSGLIDEQVNDILMLAREKPYMSFWGELFELIYFIKRIGQKLNRNIYLYNLSSGKVIYDSHKNQFVAMLPDMNVALTDHELVDALFRGILIPHVIDG